VAINVPQGYTSPDVIDRRQGQKPTLADKARDLVIKVRNDYNDSFPSKADPVAGPATPTGKIPSYKKGGRVKATGLAKLHKGERVVPKNKVKSVEKAMRKRG
jgi:hypothetical protein